MMMKTSSLSKEAQAVVLGSLLGDGSLVIQRGYKNARFCFRHSAKQRDYFMWKVSLLKEISGERCWHEQPPDGLSKYPKLHYCSRALPELTKLYELTHKRGKLRVRRKWLNMMTPLSLAIIWFDNGSIIGNGRRGVICTDRVPLKGQLVFCKYLRKVWGIKARVGRVRKGSDVYRVWIRSAESLKKLLRIVAPFAKVESVLPKLLLLYKDARAQKRWVSEVSAATGFPEEVVWKHLNEKKSRWRSFRE